MKLNLDNIKTICINCLGLLGDVLIRTTVIETIAKQCPHATITVIVEPGRDILLRNHPDIDHIILFNRNKKPRFQYLKNLLTLISDGLAMISRNSVPCWMSFQICTRRLEQ